jgi:adenosine deaminase
MKKYEEQIFSRLILSIDRTQTIEQAMETLKLAENNRKYIVGLDFSGDPNIKSFARFRSVFDHAKQINLSTTIHIGELPDEECLNENNLILDYQPTRLGHFNYRTTAQEERVLKEKIPLELCPTSNLLTMNLLNLTEHHFNLFYQIKHPLSICTDDSGLMNCCLSSEIFDIAQTFHLTKQQIYEFIFQTCDLIFDKNMIDICQQKLNSFFQQSNLF